MSTHSDLHDWIVVGGGPHGVCASRALRARGLSVRIVDPSGQLLERWEERAKSVAMSWMRSPVSHHLDDKPNSLHHFVHRPTNADVANLSGIFRLPTHAAFLRHSREVIEQHNLDAYVVPGRVESIARKTDHLVLHGKNLELRGRRVLIATGSNSRRTPDWAQRLHTEGAPVQHVFERGAPLQQDLLGGGISAIQRALMALQADLQPVRLWLRSPIEVSEFDYDRQWAKHLFLSKWGRLGEPERLDFLRRNPTRGSVTPILSERLQRAVRQGKIELEHRVPSVEWSPGDGRVILRTGERTVESTGLTLMTGFAPELVSGWLGRTAEELGLPLINGLPRLDQDMHWGHGIHVSGPLARLRLGPMAANLIGARWATSLLPPIRMQAA